MKKKSSIAVLAFLILEISACSLGGSTNTPIPSPSPTATSLPIQATAQAMVSSVCQQGAAACKVSYCLAYPYPKTVDAIEKAAALFGSESAYAAAVIAWGQRARYNNVPNQIPFEFFTYTLGPYSPYAAKPCHPAIVNGRVTVPAGCTAVDVLVANDSTEGVCIHDSQATSSIGVVTAEELLRILSGS